LFTTSGNLKRHQLVHSGEKPYHCDYCERAFSDPTLGNLKAHLKIHIADGPLKCKECGKQFTTSGNLKRHLRVHSGEKPFVCMHCQRAFADPGALQRHVRIHTGLSRFSRPQPLLPLKVYLTLSVSLEYDKTDELLHLVERLFLNTKKIC
uniref:C2H2-type domain-containing protein n=1 Tax=Sinocyclocheilus rhinocerous TaxID=307959 RepID=A0A673L452_9TELE